MWGSWWEWDPRLTSFLILFLFYLGYMALWSAIENPDSAAEASGPIPLGHYHVSMGTAEVLERFTADAGIVTEPMNMEPTL